MEDSKISKTKKIIYYVAIIAMFFNSNTFWCSSNSNLGVIIAIIGILAIAIYERFIDKFIFFVMIILSAFLLINMASTGTFNYIGMNIRMMIIVLLSILIAKYIDYKNFADIFVYIMVFITIVSLALYFLVSIKGNTSILSLFPQLTNVNGVSAYNAGFCCIYTYRYDRLMGIFWEPSIYSSFAIITLILMLFFPNHVKYRRLNCLILCLGIIASKSTGGYVLLICTILFYGMVMFENKNVKKILLCFSIVVLLTALLFKDQIITELINISPEVFYKLDVSVESGSRITRMDSGILNLKIFFDNIITGVGLGKVDDVYISMGGKNETSTLTFYLAAFGIAGIIPTVILIKSFFKQRFFYWIYRIYLVVLFSVIVLKEPYTFCCGMYTIIFILYLNTIRGTKFEIIE